MTGSRSSSEGDPSCHHRSHGLRAVFSVPGRVSALLILALLVLARALDPRLVAERSPCAASIESN